MTTVEILTRALQIAAAAHVGGKKPEIAIGEPRDGRGIEIRVTLAMNVGDYGLGEVLLTGSGATIDEAAADLLPRLREAAGLVAAALEKKRELDASRLRSIEAAMAGAA